MLAGNVRSLALTAAFAAVTSVATAANAAERWDMPTAYGASNFITQAYVAFAEDVKKRTNGELEIVVHPGGSLYQGAEILRAVREGQVPIGARFLGAHANEDPLFGLDTIPFLATDKESAWKLYQASRTELEKALADRGLKFLFAPVWPPQGLFVKKEINTLEDMKGVRFRAYDTNTSRLAELMGASPTRTEASEIAQAFSTGIADAMMASAAIGIGQAMWDYVDYYYLVNAWLPKSVVVVNMDVWDGLDESTQNALLAAAADAEATVWDTMEVENQRYLATLAENGMNVVKPSDELMAGFHEIGAILTREWLDTAGERGAAVIDAYQAK